MHDLQKTLAGLGILAGGGTQRFDQAKQGCQGRTQFMTDIGDEIGAHLFGTHRRSPIVQREHDGYVAKGLPAVET